MTADMNSVNVNDVSMEEENCGFDMTGHQDPPTPAGDCNASKEGIDNGKENMEDDPDASYVFVGGKDALADTEDLNGKSEPANLVDSRASESEVVDHETGDDTNSIILEQDASGKGENGAIEVSNGKVAVEAHGQVAVDDDSAGDVPGVQEFQVNVGAAKAAEEENMESIATQGSQVKSTRNVAELEPNQSCDVEDTVSMSITKSEWSQSGNDEVAATAIVSESESNQSGNVEVTSIMSIAEFELNQSGNSDQVADTNILAELESNQPVNVQVTGCADVAETMPNQSSNVDVTSSANITEPDQIQSVDEGKVEGKSEMNLVTDLNENKNFPIFVAEGVGNNNDLGLDEGKNNLSMNCPQRASILLEQNIEIDTSLVVTELKLEVAEAIDASSSGRCTNGLSAGHAQACDADKCVNGFVCASQNTYEQNGCSEEVENADIDKSEDSTLTDAETCNGISAAIDNDAVTEAETGNGFPAATNNDAIGGRSNNVNASLAQLDSEALDVHVTYKKGENLPSDHAEESDSRTVGNDSSHASKSTPEGNRASEVAQPVFLNKLVIESYESNPVAPASDTALESVAEIGDSCPVNDIEIDDGMRMEALVENLNVDSSDSLRSCPVSDREVVFEPECHPLTNGKMSSTDDDVKQEIETESIAIVSEEKVSAFSSNEVHLEAEVSGGATKCVSSKPTSAENQDTEACFGDSVENIVDVKAETEVEKSLEVVPVDVSHASESEVLDGSVVTSQRTLSCFQDNILGNEFVHIDSSGKQTQEMEVIEGLNREEASTSSPEGCAFDASDVQNSVVEVVKRPFYYMIRIPRYDDDENLKEQIKNAQNQVDEKTKSRDAIRAEMQRERANCNKYSTSVDAAISEETSARDLLRAKRREIDSVLAVINRGKSASELKRIDNEIYGMEHTIQHDTLPLRQEKNFIFEIKRLKQAREKLSSNFGSQEDVQEAIDQQVQSEERLKILRKEADLRRENALKAEAATKNAEKKYQEEKAKLEEFISRFRAADDIRQKAYAHLQSLRKRLYDKNKYFYKYKDDAKATSDLASKGNKGELQRHCVNQVERVMELWNNDDEFRKEYIRCNLRSTVRRLSTLDGRSLGPDEVPPLIPNFVSERFSKNNVAPSISTLQEEKTIELVETENKDDRSEARVGGQNNTNVKSKKPAKHAPLGSGLATVSDRVEIEEERVEEQKLTKEEEEINRKAEELRKEEEQAMLKEQKRLEQKAKAKEAMERKKRKALQAQKRAEARAAKEAEQRDKQKEKKAIKKEKRKALEELNGSNEGESAPSSNSPTKAQESETIEKPVALTKKSQKPLHSAKLTKPKSTPLPFRNRSRRRMQTWMWVLLIALITFALFFMGNGSFFLQRFGF